MLKDIFVFVENLQFISSFALCDPMKVLFSSCGKEEKIDTLKGSQRDGPRQCVLTILSSFQIVPMSHS